MNKALKVILKLIVHLVWAGFGVWFLMDIMNTGINEFLQMPDTSVGFWNYVFVNGALKAILTAFAIWGVVSLIFTPITLFRKLRFLALLPLVATIAGAIYFSVKFWPMAADVDRYGWWLILVIPICAVIYVFIILAFASLTLPCFAVLFANDNGENVLFHDDLVAVIVGTVLCAIVLAILAIVASIIAFFAKMIIVGILIAIVIGVILSMPVTYAVVVYVGNK